MNNRRIMFSLATLIAAGMGMAGCDDSSSGSSSNGGGDSKPEMEMCGDVECVKGSCIDGVCEKTCEDAGGCDTADPCADIEVCHSDKSCKGKADCNYECGVTEHSCQWKVCSTDPRCTGACDPETLPTGADDDFDGDGIPNRVELNSSILDPCLADTDGDTIPDNLEDLNGNGAYEPWLGETNPNDPESKPSSEGVALVNAVCTMDALSAVSTENLETFRVAVPMGIGNVAMVKSPVEKAADVMRFDDKQGIAMLFASTKAASYSAKTIFQTAARNAEDKILSFVEASNFSSEVPLTSWIESGYKKDELQIVPDHEVTRNVYRVGLSADTSIQELRDRLASVLSLQDRIEVVPSSEVKKCAPDESGNVSATVYLARSTYEEDKAKVTLHSIAIACSEDATQKEVVNARMTDIMSGTHVSPKGLPSANYGFSVGKTLKCQQADFGDSSSKVDFIWVVDNSGSMKDELDNLAATVEIFMDKLNRSKIDYHIGVAATDSYVLEEWVYGKGLGLGSHGGAGGVTNSGWLINPFSSGDEENKELADDVVNVNAYFTYSGLRKPTGNHSRSMMTAIEAKRSSIGTALTCKGSQFECLVRGSSGNTCGGLNLCGLGHEDGLKSGLVTLERLSLDISKPYDEYADATAEEIPDEADRIKENAKRKEQRKKSNSVFNRITATHSACKTAEDLATKECQNQIAGQMLRDDALRYIIWVSDEESRQFKEPAGESANLISNSTSLRGCLTGYRLDASFKEGVNQEEFNFDDPDLSALVYTMRRGSYADKDENECNPSMKGSFTADVDGVQKYVITEDSTLGEIYEKNRPFYDMLMYYISEYQKFAGENGIAGFALVGDIGKAQGGFCDELKNTADAQDGANYGLGYIMMAKYLSKLTNDGANDGKGGGYASICSKNYGDTVDAIFQDVLGRLSRHGLEGYPVSSTIRVAIVKKGGDTAVELVRGKDWSYDASQNTITFSYSGSEPTDKIAISYVLWQKNQG